MRERDREKWGERDIEGENMRTKGVSNLGQADYCFVTWLDIADNPD